VMSGSGYYSQNDLRLHFGLGAVERVDLVEVAWPSGAKDAIRDVVANRSIVIRETSG
jgi:enediyne biosynthesis protein E4